MIFQGGWSGPPAPPPPLWIRTWPDNRDLHRIEQNSCLGGTKINKGCVVYLRNRSALAVNCYVITHCLDGSCLRRSNHVSACSQSLRFILSLRLYSSFITSRPGKNARYKDESDMLPCCLEPSISKYIRR